MGCACFKAKVNSNPKQIHQKKLEELFHSYIKNQNKDPKTYKGNDSLTPAIIEQVTRYSQQSVKELVRIIQIDKKYFIAKVCQMLIKNSSNSQKYQRELRLLSLTLLRDLMLANLEEKRVKNPKIASEKRKDDDLEQTKTTKTQKKNLKRRGNRDVSTASSNQAQSNTARGAMHHFIIKGADFIKRGGNQRFNNKLTQLQQRIVKKMSNDRAKQQLKESDNSTSDKYLFCVVNERQIFQCIQNLIRTEPIFSIIGAEMLNILIDHTNKSQQIATQDEYFELVQYMLDSCVKDAGNNFRFQYESIQAFKSIIKILKESSFQTQWSFILHFTLDFVSTKRAVDYIENFGNEFQDENEDSVSESNHTSNSDSEQDIKPVDNKDENNLYYDLTIQIAFDTLSYLSQRANFDQELNVGSQFISTILASINKQHNWHSVKWVKFIMMLIVCNGGNLSNQGLIDFDEPVQTRFMKLMMDHQQNSKESQASKLLDFECLYSIINSLLNELLMETVHKTSSGNLNVSEGNALQKIQAIQSPGDNLEITKLINQVTAKLNTLTDLFYLQAHAPKGIEQTKISRCFKQIMNYTSVISYLNSPVVLVNEALLLCFEAYTHSLPNLQEVMKLLDMWIIMSKNEILLGCQQSHADRLLEVEVQPINYKFITIFLEGISTILRIIKQKMEQSKINAENSSEQTPVQLQEKEESLKSIDQEHQIMLLQISNRLYETQGQKWHKAGQCVNKALNINLQIQLINEELIAFSDRQNFQTSYLLNYLTALGKLFLQKEHFSKEVQEDLFQSWFVLNHQIFQLSQVRIGNQLVQLNNNVRAQLHTKPYRHLATLLAFLCFLAGKSNSRLLVYQFLLTIKQFQLLKLFECLKVCVKQYDQVLVFKDRIDKLSEKFVAEISQDLSLSKNQNDLVIVSKKELLDLDIEADMFQDAFVYFNDPMTENSSLIQQFTPVALNEIDLEFKKINLVDQSASERFGLHFGAQESIAATVIQQPGFLLDSNSSIVY